MQVALSCLHVALEHSQAIVGVIQEGLYASALALNRMMVEAFFRGCWLKYAAHDAHVEAATRDPLPKAFFSMVADVEGAPKVRGQVSKDDRQHQAPSVLACV